MREMKGYSLISLLSVFSFCAFAPISLHAADTLKKITFDYTQSGTTYQLARVALRDTLLPLENKIKRRITVFTAKADLNNDDIPEIIVKLNDKKLFCSEEQGCDTYVFAISENGPEQIGHFKSDELYIDDTVYNKVKKIQTKSQYDNAISQYVWDNGAFIEFKKEGLS